MPVKLKPSQVRVDRNTKVKTIEHFYAKTTPKSELFDMLNNSNTKKKVKQKIRNELVRRGVKIEWVLKSDS